MTAAAAIGQLAAVWIAASMAVDACLAELLPGDLGCVACRAGNFGVYAGQGELMAAGMIIVGHLPVGIIVAVVTMGTESRGVDVIRPVAAVAVLGYRILVVAAAVAREAIDARVRAEQRVAGFLQMIEFGGPPLLGDVTLRAICSARSAVHVIGGMAAGASAGGGFVVTRRVTGIARHRGVSARQGEARLFVMEGRCAPIIRTVALGAGLGELAAVHIIALVTARASGGHGPPGGPRLVTGLAGKPGMSSPQRQVCELMIKVRRIEPDDIGFAALVFRVTGTTLARRRILHAAVIAAVLALVGGDVLVAIQAQRGLGAGVRAVVAIGAGGLQFGVRAADLAGHQQSLY